MSNKRVNFNVVLIILCLIFLGGIIFIWRQSFFSFYRNLTTEEAPEAIEVRTNNNQANSNIEVRSPNQENQNSNDQNINSNLKQSDRDLNIELRNSSDEDNDATKKATQLGLPVEYNLKVPFVRQAPFDDWSEPFEEACEEAAVLTVHYWHQGLAEVSQQQMKDDILAAVAWQEDYFGSHKDLTAEETVDFIKQYYHYQNVELRYDIVLEDIKQTVYSGYPVIVPAAGREMGNVNFRTPGPLYHMTVIKGWTKRGGIITNDPGTRRGADYIYDPDKLYNAIHDWNDGDVSNGRKAMIIIK